MPDPKRDDPRPTPKDPTPAAADVPRPHDNPQPPAAAPAAPDPMRPASAVKVERKKSRKATETVPGGRYVVDAVHDDETGECVSGRVVDAEGKEIGAFGEDEEAKTAAEVKPKPKDKG